MVEEGLEVTHEYEGELSPEEVQDEDEKLIDDIYEIEDEHPEQHESLSINEDNVENPIILGDDNELGNAEPESEVLVVGDDQQNTLESQDEVDQSDKLTKPSDATVEQDTIIDDEEQILDTEQENQLFIVMFDDVEELQPDTWDTINVGDRLSVLQTIEDHMAEIQGRPPAEIIGDATLNETEYGGYNPVTNVITINENHLASDMPVDEFLDTILHEGRHAYQQFAVNNPGTEKDTELVDAWADNLKPGNYLSPREVGQEAYQNQPIESDAWNYAQRIRSLFNNDFGGK